MEVKQERYLRMVLQRNETMNLTGISNFEEAAVRHTEDSLALLPLLPQQAVRVVDVGSGGGFPGMALKIARPSMDLTLLDATAKKTDFLRAAAAALGLSGLQVLHGRAETLCSGPPHREAYDIAVSRGVAALGVLAELCLPFLRVGGLLLAMKQNAQELSDAVAIVKALGGTALDSHDYTLSNGLRHTVIRIEKTAPTPACYPRRFAKINGRPL